MQVIRTFGVTKLISPHLVHSLEYRRNPVLIWCLSSTELEGLSGYIKLSADNMGTTFAVTWSLLRPELHLKLADTQF